MPSDMIQEFRQWQKSEGISLNLEWIGTESVNEPQMEVSSGSYKLDRLFIYGRKLWQMDRCRNVR